MKKSTTTAISLPSPAQACLGRQPVFDRSRNLVGYELLYRAEDAQVATFSDGVQATSTVLLNSVLEFGIDSVVGDATAWVNFPGQFLENGFPVPLRPQRMVVELLEEASPTDQLLRALTALVDAGYQLALDDCVYKPELRPLLDLAHIVKIEVKDRSPVQIAESVACFSPYSVELVAEKVETSDEYSACLDLGFDYFQGYYLSKPEVLKKACLPANHLALLRAMGVLQLEDPDFNSVVSVIRQDPALSFRLLRFLNSAHFNLNHRIASVQHAVAMLGLGEVRRMVLLLMLGHIVSAPQHLLKSALTRARTCELLSYRVPGLDADCMFLVGLLSMMDALLGVSAVTVLELVPVTRSVEQALLSREGTLGQLLARVELYDEGRWNELDRLLTHESSLVDWSDIGRAWLEALQWTSQVGALVA